MANAHGDEVLRASFDRMNSVDDVRRAPSADAACNGRPATAVEMAQEEEKAALALRLFVDSFIHFPTEANRARIVDRMADFQSAWMNGRRRVL